MTDIERIEGSTVPAAYAEKTMGTIVRLHEDLIAEKEKRIALLEKLSAKEQALAEAMAYVALLEAELERAGRAPVWRPQGREQARAGAEAPRQAPQPARAPRASPEPAAPLGPETARPPAEALRAPAPGPRAAPESPCAAAPPRAQPAHGPSAVDPIGAEAVSAVDAWARWTLARSAGGVRVEPPAKAARPEPQRPAAPTPRPAAARRSEDWRAW